MRPAWTLPNKPCQVVSLHALLLVCAGTCVMDVAAFSPPALTAPQQLAPTPVDEAEPIVRSRAPSDTRTPMKYPLPPIDPTKVDAPTPMDIRQSISVPDRWRIMDSLGFKFPWYDPYNHNVWKGDKPFPPFAKLHGGNNNDWFLALSVISDSLIETRRLPLPVGAQSSLRPDANNVFGRGKQTVFVETVILSAAVIKGNTTFRPPDYEFRFVPAFQINHARIGEVRGLKIDPRLGKSRTDRHFAVQELFGDVHLRNVSDHYDFDSLRVGIQPFISDFRGFVFQDVPFGVRLFGNRDNNFWQYNVGYFRRMEKDTNSGLNDFSQKMRRDHLFVANAYHQDFPVIGHTTQATIIHNVNRESAADYYDRNGFLIRPAVIGDARPRNYNVTYVGLSGDGHIDRWNLTTSVYGAFGTDQRHPLAQKKQTIRAGFAAAELSRDFSWLRVRGNALIASGDKNPFDGKATGFDAIFENPQFAGADTSFFIRQAIPLLGGGGVALSQRNGVLPSLRSSKDQGQSNFVNPGLTLIGMGADADLTPRIRLIANISKLNFINTSSLSVLRNQHVTSKNLGVDISAGVQIRPVMSQNIVLNISGAALLPGRGLKQLYDEDKRGPQYSVLFNLILTY